MRNANAIRFRKHASDRSASTADALDQRVWTWDGAETNFFVYDGGHAVAETDATGGLRRAYTLAPRTDRWLAMTVYSHPTNTPSTYYYLTDRLDTVHALADETGAVVESYVYDAWGRVLGVYDGAGQPLSASAVGNRILFQGREYDWAVGLYLFRARWYNPVTGRWLSKDPLGISGGVNQYAFCENAPMNYRDPEGKWVSVVVGGAVGTIWGSVQGGWSGGWKGAAAGALGGALSGAIIGAGGSPVLAGAIGGVASSTLGQLLNGQNPVSGAGMGKIGVSAVAGGFFGKYAGNYQGVTAQVLLGLGSGTASVAGETVVDAAKAGADALSRLGNAHGNAINSASRLCE